MVLSDGDTLRETSVVACTLQIARSLRFPSSATGIRVHSRRRYRGE
jgi:hypothetical protein